MRSCTKQCMRELGFLGGERLRRPNDLDDEVVVAYAAVGRRPRTGRLRETLDRRAIDSHGLWRDRTAGALELIAIVLGRGGAPRPHAMRRRLESISCSSGVTRTASAEVRRQ